MPGWPSTPDSSGPIDPAAGAAVVAAPGVPSLGAVLAWGAAAAISGGLLEAATLLGQVQGLHIVDWSTLMINRHTSWLVAVSTCLLVLPVIAVFILPVLVWARRRARSAGALSPAAARRVASWSGLVLFTFLFLGPCLAIRGLHPAGACVLALGLGSACGRWLARGALHSARAGLASAIGSGLLCGLAALATHGEELRQQLEVLFAGSSVEAQPQPESMPPNLLWIVLDTLSAQRMSLYAYHRPTTPGLEEWSRQGITFDMARSAAPWTLPSHVTMFTGLWPFEHEADVSNPYCLEAPTLAEHLADNGFQTAGIVANTRMCNSAYGVSRGFGHYVDYPWKHDLNLTAILRASELGRRTLDLARRLSVPVPDSYPFLYRRSAAQILAEGRSWLDNAWTGDPHKPGENAPYFLFLNLMDVHGPYLPSAEAPEHFCEGPPPTRANARPEDGWIALKQRNQAAADQRAEREEELSRVSTRLGDLYDECLSGLDLELNRFLHEMQTAGYLDNAWVVITADHGEHFGEHDQFGHGSSLYNEAVHVPLALLPPLKRTEGDEAAVLEQLRGLRINVPVSLRDLPATMATTLLPDVPSPFPGQSLARFWNPDGTERQTPVLSQLQGPRLQGENFRTRQGEWIDAIVDGRFVFIESNTQPVQLYDLYTDPRQLRNLAGEPSLESEQLGLRETLGRLVR